MREGRKEEWMDGRNEGMNEQKGGRDLDERNEGTTTRDREGTRTRDIQDSPEGANEYSNAVGDGWQNTKPNKKG